MADKFLQFSVDVFYSNTILLTSICSNTILLTSILLKRTLMMTRAENQIMKASVWYWLPMGLSSSVPE